MFYVVNLETRAILTYRDGCPITDVNEQLQKDKAIFAQTFKEHPHAVIPMFSPGNDALAREVAPWLKK